MWTYNYSTLATTPKDQIRLIIEDTNSTNQLLQDEEINFYLTMRASIYGAAALCCLSLSAQNAGNVSIQAGDTKIAYTDISKAWAAKAQAFAAMAAAGGAGLPYSGGISVADKQNNEQDPDRVEPQFSIGMFDSDLPIGQLAVDAPDGAQSNQGDE